MTTFTAVDWVAGCCCFDRLLQERAQAIAFAKGQIDYALGSAGRSYVIGFGTGWSK